MRLDFNILWVENLPGSVNAQRERIDFLIRKEGFRLQTQFAGTVNEARTFLSSDIFGDHIDLILMDYDLGAGPKGDDGIEVVRNAFSYKDIIFYSAQASDLTSMVAARKLQGVFCSTRNDLPDSVVGVFESLVKKVLDIDHSRGIIMGSTSDIDNLVNDCLGITCDEGGGRLAPNAVKIIVKRLGEIKERFLKDLEIIASATEINHLFKMHHVYTSVDRLNLLRKSLDQAKFAAHLAAMSDYAQNTIPKRNLLAHVRVQRDGFSRKLYNKDGKELTSEEMKQLRHELLKHQEIFEELSKTLTGVPQ